MTFPFPTRHAPAQGGLLIPPGGRAYVGTFESGFGSAGLKTTIIDISHFAADIDAGGLEVYVEWLDTRKASFPGITGQPTIQAYGEAFLETADGTLVFATQPFATGLAWGDGFMRGTFQHDDVIPSAWITGDPATTVEGDEFPSWVGSVPNASVRRIRIRAQHLSNISSTYQELSFRAVYLVRMPYLKNPDADLTP